MLSTLLLQALAPAVGIVWLWTRRSSSRAAWLRASGLVLGGVASASLVLPWLTVPVWGRYMLLAGWVVAAVRSGRRIARAASSSARRRWARAGAALQTVGLLLLWGLAGIAVDGRRLPDGDTLDVRCPLGPGAYLVANGGSRQLVNAHLQTLADEPRYEPWRGQSYGLDLVQVDGFGRRAVGLSPPNLGDYRIYGQLVLAPCPGTVVRSVDGRPDMRPGTRDPDRTQLAGNHVVVACGAYDVLLAHLQPGSLRVTPGDEVSTGDLLGFVGNSGNTDEPHLHISAQQRAADAPPVGGEPVRLTIDQVFPVRNDRIDCE